MPTTQFLPPVAPRSMQYSYALINTVCLQITSEYLAVLGRKRHSAQTYIAFRVIGFSSPKFDAPGRNASVPPFQPHLAGSHVSVFNGRFLQGRFKRLVRIDFKLFAVEGFALLA